MRDLSGDPQFIRPAQGCYPFGVLKTDSSTADGRFLVSVLDKVQKKGGGKLSMNPCTEKTFGEFDILIFSPAQINSAQNTAIKPATVRPIVDAFNQGAFKPFDEFKKSEFVADAQVRADEIAKDEERRLRDKAEAKRAFEKDRKAADISAIYVKLPATSICVGGADRTDLQSALENQQIEQFSDLMTPTTKILAPMAANPIFMALKRRDCDAVVAPTKMLKEEIVKGLLRDNIVFDYHPQALIIEQGAKTASTVPGQPATSVRQ